MNRSRALVALLTAFLLLVGIGCTRVSTAPDEVALCIGGGPVEAKQIKQVVSPGHGKVTCGWWGDTSKTYPTSLRVYDASDDEGSDGPPIVAPSSDGVEMQYSVRVRFKLNTGECPVGDSETETEECIRQFHEEVGNRYEADGGENDEGWQRMLEAVFRGELDTSLQRISRNFSATDLAFNGETLNDVEEQLQEGLRTQINESVDGEFFCGPGHEYGSGSCPEFEASITVIRPHRQATREAFEAVQQEAALTRAAEQRIDTATAEAQARQIVQQSLEGGNSEALVLLEAIESGDIQFWVIPSDGDLSITAPSPGG